MQLPRTASRCDSILGLFLSFRCVSLGKVELTIFIIVLFMVLKANGVILNNYWMRFLRYPE